MILLFSGIVALPVAAVGDINVTTAVDEFGAGAACSLREAIQSANTDTDFGGCTRSGTAPYTVNVPADIYTLTITGDEDANAQGDLDLTASMDIAGAGAKSTIIQACDGDSCTGVDRVLHIDPLASGIAVNISGVTFSNGEAGANNGGGILMVDGTVTLTDVAVDSNNATDGGGIYMAAGSLDLIRTTVSRNETSNDGAGIFIVSGDFTTQNSTISTNRTFISTEPYGFGIVVNGGTTEFENSTITENSQGGVLQTAGSVTFRNSIVSGNSFLEGDCIGTFTSFGNNIFGGSIDVYDCPIGGSDIQPQGRTRLMILADNGGQTETHAPSTGSPVINAGSCSAFGTDGIDQRGLTRPVGQCDIGAFEVQATVNTINYEVDTETDDVALNACTAAPNDCSFRGALANLNTNYNPVENPVIIDIPEGHYRIATADAPSDETGDFDIRVSATIRGAGADKTILDGNGLHRVLQMSRLGSTIETNEPLVTISGVTITGGNTTAPGGGVRAQGELTIKDSVIDGNSSGCCGGGLIIFASDFTLENVTVSNNHATGDGAGIYTQGSNLQDYTFDQVTVYGNTSGEPGSGGDGAGLWAFSSNTIEINNSTFAGNHAVEGSGGGIYLNSGAVTLTNTIVTGNLSGDGTDCGGGSLGSGGHNLVGQAGDANGCPSGSTGDMILAGLAGSVVKSLGNYGGTLPTVALVPDGAAVNTGDCSINEDQRGFQRPQGLCDVGAFEQQPPTGTNDVYNGTPNETFLIGAGGGVLANDTDPDSDTLSAMLVDDVSAGILNLASDGGFTYIPPSDFAGTATFTYMATDGAFETAPVTVSLNVLNDPPLAVDDSYLMRQGQTLDVSAGEGVLNNDSDLNGDDLTAVLVRSTSNGALELRADGSFFYSPGEEFFGTDTFTYTANDGAENSDVATVTISTLLGPGGMTVEGDLENGPVRPMLVWIPFENEQGEIEAQEWYNIFFWEETTTTRLFWLWFDGSLVCEGERCELPLTEDLIPASLTNGVYRWWIRNYDTDTDTMSDWSNDDVFEVDFASPVLPTGFTVTANQGRPSVSVPNDPGAAWYQVKLENDSFSGAAWTEKDKSLCDEGRCIVHLDVHPVNGSYSVSVQAWGPNGFNDDDPTAFAGPQSLTVQFDQPGAPQPLSPTASPGEANISWQGEPGTTWYNVWLGTEDFSQQVSFEWHSALDLGCADADVCSLTITSPDIVAGETYRWYVRGWGPGGLSTGGLDNSGFAEGFPFTP